ncbi:hypothetical protein ACFQL1_15080 [Halomicroarcula sp. GCM10025709]|uniref:hypothetical protein n=1 Tax=Haloarcula TaxID=2237 RepID=UPI0024C2DFAF|nr:hypothetical protein [Halomicroarcula sp. YJ-61-S]
MSQTTTWGEQTVQAVGEDAAPKDWHTDADEIRRRFSIPALDVEAFTDQHPKAIAYPDMVVHEKTPDRTLSTKGTDGLFRGDRDCGKTTFALNLSARLMDENDERVIWRGRKGGSGWLAFAPWTTLYLPSEVEIDATWMDDHADIAMGGGEAAALDDVVRDVYRYDGIYDLLRELGERPGGTFNVVYPDPLFRDCHEVTKETDRGQFAGGLPFTPEHLAGEDDTPTPLTDWWAPFLVARAEHGPFEWTSWVCDEAGDLFPEHARNEDGRPLYDLIDMLRGVWATSRKRFLSLFMFVHHEANLHSELRREFKWRVVMPDGRSNPIAGSRATHPVGFKGDIPMEADLMSGASIGEALCYTKQRWSFFGWDDISCSGENADRWLSISTNPDPKREIKDDAGGEASA